MLSGAGWAVSTASGASGAVNTTSDIESEMVECASRASDTAEAVEAGSIAGGVDLLSSRYRSGVHLSLPSPRPLLTTATLLLSHPRANRENFQVVDSSFQVRNDWTMGE